MSWLNSPIATALARAAMLACPVLFAGAIWASTHFIQSQVSASPGMQTLIKASAEHEKRLTTLEEGERRTTASSNEVVKQLDRQSSEIAAMNAQLYRLIGIIEAQQKR
jgi:hypothetical protein